MLDGLNKFQAEKLSLSLNLQKILPGELQLLLEAMGKQAMEQPNFEQMTDSQLIDYHLEHGIDSEALSIYVQRLNNDPKTVWVKPEHSLQELDKLIQSLQSKN